LAHPKDDDTMSAELESRLDDLFGENDIPLPDSQDGDSTDYYPLAELKNLIFSIDWEITDEVLVNFIQQLQDLKLAFQHDKIVFTFLQILNSLGDYIKTNRSKSHPKTFKILNSVFSSLDKVVLSKDMTESEKKKMLWAEMKRYKELRTHIAQSKSVQQRKAVDVSAKAEQLSDKIQEEEAVIEETRPALQQSEAVEEEFSTAEQPGETADIPLRGLSAEDLAKAVREIKQYIHAEINALKNEIDALRDRR
jgi:hypothetical protein